MKKNKEDKFGKDFNVYVKYDNEYSCYSFDYYEKHKDLFEGKELIIAHKDVSIYFRPEK